VGELELRKTICTMVDQHLFASCDTSEIFEREQSPLTHSIRIAMNGMNWMFDQFDADNAARVG
jgi:hypothetical protein